MLVNALKSDTRAGRLRISRQVDNPPQDKRERNLLLLLLFQAIKKTLNNMCRKVLFVKPAAKVRFSRDV